MAATPRLRQMRALVTGGAGFIGSNLVDALIERGDEVVVLDDLSTGRRSNLAGAIERGATLIEGSITDPTALAALFAEHTPELVFHLAAQVDVRRSVADPAFDTQVNVGGTINLLEAARAHGAPRMIFSSTGGAIYGEVEDALLPISEDVPPAPMAPYGQSKFAAEGYVALAARLHNQPGAVLRYANVYGPRQDPLGEGGVVAIFCKNAIDGERPSVFGDGRQTRDFIHVDDVVAANLAAAERPIGAPVNIGTAKETSVLDLVDALAPLASGDFTPEFKPRREGEVERSVLSARRAAEQLGWTPKVSLTESLPELLERVRADVAPSS